MLTAPAPCCTDVDSPESKRRRFSGKPTAAAPGLSATRRQTIAHLQVVKHPTVGMGLLDGIPLHFARQSSPQTPNLASPLLCLFFSAQWCPDCVRFLPSLMEAYKGFEPGKVDIVFVSSDRSKELQQRYMETAQHPDWPAVSFEGDHRADLKKRFGVCAGAEMSALGMTSADRKGGIPTLAVFRASDGVLLTMEGVNDIVSAGAGAIDRWEAAATGESAGK